MKSALSRPKSRAALMQELEHAVRRSSALGVIFGQTVASRVGISSSDLECLDFLNLEGRVTAGRLAEVTGLTTGAITGVVDRLEKAGLVRRERSKPARQKLGGDEHRRGEDERGEDRKRRGLRTFGVFCEEADARENP